MRRLIDCFLFYNELDMLAYRLTVLNDTVDAFVIVEAPLTFTGRPKPFFFEEHRDRFAAFASKIVHVKLDGLPYPNPDVGNNEQWTNENHQRDRLIDGVQTFPGLRDDDIVLLSDVDEIFDPTTLTKLRDDLSDDALYAFRMKYHSYNVNVIRDLDWYHPKAFSVRCWKDVLQRRPLSSVRLLGITETCPCRLNVVERGGWHLSYFGSPAFVRNKIENFSHQEFCNERILNLSGIEARMAAGTDIMAQEEVVFRKVPACRNVYLPPRYDTLLADYVVL